MSGVAPTGGGEAAVAPARRRWRWLRRLLVVSGAVVLAAVLYVAVGLIPVNAGFEPTPGGVAVSVVSSAVHADVVLPIRHGATDWRAWLGEGVFEAGWPEAATHVAIGWGDRGFFLNTPEWSDLRPGTAARALLWPSDTCMHVSLTRPDFYADQELRTVRLSDAQHAALVAFVRESFSVDAHGQPGRLEGEAYGSYDAFFGARGGYHAARNCNNWVGAALRSAGATAPWYTPIPGTPTWYLPAEPTP